MTTSEIEQKRLEATEVWLEYTRIFPDTKISIYDYLHYGYTLDEAKAFIKTAVTEQREIGLAEISAKNVHLP